MSILNLTHLQAEKVTVFYKLCAGHIKLSELSDEDMLRFCTSTKFCANAKRRGEQRWAMDWQGIGLDLHSKEYDKIWAAVAEHVEGAPVRAKNLPKKTIPAKLFQIPATIAEHLKEDESPAENVYNIFDATGKVVHKVQLEAFISGEGIVTPEKQAVDFIKRLKLDLSQLAEVQRYLNRSVQAKTKKFRLIYMKLPDYLVELQDKLLDTKAKLLSEQDLPNLSYYIGKLGLQGYRFVEVEPVHDKQGDVSFFKALDTYSFAELKDKDFPSKGSYGIACPKLKQSNRPVQAPRDTWHHYKLEKTDYLGAVLKNYRDHKDIIQEFTKKPKPFYITRDSLDAPYKWNYEAIALDFYHTHNIAVHPEVFENTSIFLDREPLEWLNEI
ncbi:hypothetical protein FDJ20_gp113 [Vibrio phage Thalassa]|uniref:Uncharacterized protein n=1 Tax=Vibrio phage Thalassa TaxID=2570301 RepID=A0A2H5BHF1_9CAUD|nr:hypothetical protein FDJ20_gp113 [Vibrio phage Thalassa]AUG85389.1 hypothetical protein THALASSA_210 [Vibrio phage Thalassa]